jgi:hypothetical protein
MGASFQRHRRNDGPREIAHSLNNVTSIISATVHLLARGDRSDADRSLLRLLEHAAREAEELASRVAGLQARESAAVAASPTETEAKVA